MRSAPIMYLQSRASPGTAFAPQSPIVPGIQFAAARKPAPIADAGRVVSEGRELVRKFLIDRFCEAHSETPAKVEAVLSAWKQFEPITPTLQ
jgi:hypothetical protein